MFCKDDKTYLGTKLKYRLKIVGDNFDMDEEDFEVAFVGGKGTVVVRKEEMITTGDGKYYVLVDTNRLGPGILKAVITAHIHDYDFPDGIRDEVDVINRLTYIYEK